VTGERFLRIQQVRQADTGKEAPAGRSTWRRHAWPVTWRRCRRRAALQGVQASVSVTARTSDSVTARTSDSVMARAVARHGLIQPLRSSIVRSPPYSTLI
jgi:hypothetical protein